MTYEETLDELRSLADPNVVDSMARYGITPKNPLGITIPQLRKLAKRIGRDHRLAGRLWRLGIHEARILASMIDDPAKVTEAQMERWVRTFYSWDLVDLCCGNLLDQTELAWDKAVEWSEREPEFEKRAGFVMMAALAVHDKQANDEDFEQFFPIIVREANDPRNFVRKAVNWALRQIGKRNRYLNRQAVRTARQVQKLDTKPARWIAADALRELTSEKVQKRLAKKSKSGK